MTITEAIAMSPRLQAHLKMADRYLVALRDGMTLAYLLNRTFVFPQFGCLCDRSEWPYPVRDSNPGRSRLLCSTCTTSCLSEQPAFESLLGKGHHADMPS